MNRVEEYFQLLQRSAQRTLTPGQTEDDALLALMVHMAFSDGHVHDNEIAFLAQVLPGRSEQALQEWVTQVSLDPAPLRAIADAFPTADEKWKGLRFAARMAWKDGEVSGDERELLDTLATHMALPKGAVDRVIHEMKGMNLAGVPASELRKHLHDIGWHSVQFAAGSLCSPDLIPLVPMGATLVSRLGLDSVEVMAFYEEGLLARFREGTAFLRWRTIVAWTHGTGLGDTVRLHTEDGRTWTLVDQRTNGLCVLLQRILDDMPDKD
jgi:hypothetical protein